MVDPAAISGIIELAKMGLSIYFQASREAGLNEEEAKILFESERIKFQNKNPNNLKDV